MTRQDTDNALNLKPMAHDGLMTKTEGTWAFWSPEMCEGGRSFSGYAADLWAAGVCLYIFATGKLPFYSESPGDLMDMIKEGNVPYDDENMSDPLVDLLHMALHKDPERRAGVGDCLQHPFLATARAHRIKQLSDEFARSKATNTVVEESDIRHVSILGPLFATAHVLPDLRLPLSCFVVVESRHFVSSHYYQLCCSDQLQSSYKRVTKKRGVVYPPEVWESPVRSPMHREAQASILLLRRMRK